MRWKKEVINSLYLVLIKHPLKCCVLFIKNKEIREKWGNSDNDRTTLEPVAYGAGWCSGKGTCQGVRSQVMPIIGGEILTKPVLLSEAEDQPPCGEAQGVVVGWPALLGFGSLVRPHYGWVPFSWRHTHPRTKPLEPPSKILHSWNAINIANNTNISLGKPSREPFLWLPGKPRWWQFTLSHMIFTEAVKQKPWENRLWNHKGLS